MVEIAAELHAIRDNLIDIKILIAILGALFLLIFAVKDMGRKR